MIVHSYMRFLGKYFMIFFNKGRKRLSGYVGAWVYACAVRLGFRGNLCLNADTRAVLAFVEANSSGVLPFFHARNKVVMRNATVIATFCQEFRAHWRCQLNWTELEKGSR